MTQLGPYLMASSARISNSEFTPATPQNSVVDFPRFGSC